MKLFFLLLVFGCFSLVKGQCSFYTDNCVFPPDSDQVFCYLSGKAGEPSLDEILAQTYTSVAQIGCPQMSTRGYAFILFLLVSHFFL